MKLARVTPVVSVISTSAAAVFVINLGIFYSILTLPSNTDGPQIRLEPLCSPDHTLPKPTFESNCLSQEDKRACVSVQLQNRHMHLTLRRRASDQLRPACADADVCIQGRRRAVDDTTPIRLVLPLQSRLERYWMTERDCHSCRTWQSSSPPAGRPMRANYRKIAPAKLATSKIPTELSEPNSNSRLHNMSW